MNSNKGFVQNSDRMEQADRETISSTTTKIPVIEEQVRVEKKIVENESIRIHKKVHTDDVLVEVPVISEQFEIERVPVNKYVDTPPAAVRHEGDTMIVPVLKEVVVKRLVLVEELHIKKRKIKDQHTQEFVLRTEEVSVERSPKDKDK